MFDMWFYMQGITGRILLLIGQWLVLMFCLSYIGFIYAVDILPDKNAKETFIETNCTVVNERLSMKGRVFHSYRADFLVNYSVNNRPYSHWVSGNGLNLAFTQNKAEQQALIASFVIGNNYSCWYNPDKPDIVMLVQRHSWHSTFPLVVPSIVGLIVFYYLLKNLFELFAEIKSKSRQIKKSKNSNNQDVKK